MTPDPVAEQPAAVPMTAEDERHMKQVGMEVCRLQQITNPLLPVITATSH
jgi:hypothetical protein